jgi:aldehyde:ferredoxin oxidoreductase
VSDRDKLTSIISTMADEFRNNPGQQNMGNYGTSGFIPTLQTQGILPTKNFQEGEFNGAGTLSGQHLETTISMRHLHCQGCYLPHDRCVDVKSSPYGPVDPAYGGDEYETAASFGSLCLVDDLVPVNVANQLCNMYGVDTISAGVIIAWVMECYERGILSTQDLDGIEAKWGDAHAMLALLEKLCKREGIGDTLAEGVKGAAAKVGKGSEQYAMHVKGLEIAMHEPRGKKGLALIYTAAGARGASHMEAAHDTAFEADNAVPELGITKGVSRFSAEGKGETINKAADVRTLINDLDICCFIFEPAFGRGTMARLGELVNALTGWNLTTQELMTMGARANSLARAFNVREGVSRRDDYLPARFSEPLPSGGSQGHAVTRAEMDRMLDDFYTSAGWSKDGVPTPETLANLGIGWVTAKIAELRQTPRPN